MDKVNIAKKFLMFGDHWHPRIVAEVNDSYVKLARLHGEFVWHNHEIEDEMFLVVRGSLRIKLRDNEILLGEGELAVIPRGVEHCPVADEECEVMLFEPKGTLNTGGVKSRRTVEKLDWI